MQNENLNDIRFFFTAKLWKLDYKQCLQISEGGKKNNSFNIEF